MPEIAGVYKYTVSVNRNSPSMKPQVKAVSSGACDTQRALHSATLPPSGMSIALAIWSCIWAGLAIVTTCPMMVRTIGIRKIVLRLWRGHIIAADFMVGV